MTDRDPPIQLLADLLKLRRRYGDGAVRELAEWLRDPTKVRELQDALEAAIKIPLTPRKTARKQKSKAKSATQILERLSRTEPERAAQLAMLRDALLAKEVLPTARELRAFAEDVGLKLPNTADRRRLISSLIRALSELDPADMRRCLKQVKPATGPADRTLEGWADLILRKRHAEPEE